MWRRASFHATSWKPEPHPALGHAMVMGDAAKRQTFHCNGCGATLVLLNVTLLGLLLRAIATGSRTVRLHGPEALPLYRPDSGRVAEREHAAPLPAAARRHTCTLWCSGGEHAERVGPYAPWSDDEIRAECESYGLEVTRIEPTPGYLGLPGHPPGRLVWFRTQTPVGSHDRGPSGVTIG